MRLIQSIGITLAIINFFIILFHFIKQLRRSDKIADTARNEREQILNTVNEGLFLLDNHFIIGKQYSQILHKMLGKKEIAGLTFKALLGDIVSEKNLITAKEFIELLFSPRIKENLINDLNPLDKIQINLQDDTGRFITKYIRFSFARVHQQHSIDTILVTVTDITNETLLSAQLDKAKEQSHRQFETLSTLINIEPKQLSLFLGNTNHTFNKINNALKLPSKNQVHYQDKINDILGLMHSVKGESSSLGFHELADKAHQFENELKPLKEKAVMDGNDFLSGVVILEEMMKQVEALKKLASELSSHNIGNNPPASIPARYDWKHLHQLTESTARRQHKTVELYTAGLHEISLPDNLRQAVSSIAIQLVRNAISHGIELPAERLKKGKPLASQLHINLYQNKKGKILLVVQDDGNGINKKQLLARAMETNIINEKQASSMDNKQTLELIFHPDFSIKEDIDIDAGQGIGMESVRRIVQNWKGQIKLKSHIGNGTTFYITLDPSSHHTKKAA